MGKTVTEPRGTPPPSPYLQSCPGRIDKPQLSAMMFNASGQSPPSETTGATPSWLSPRDRCLRCIDPSDVGSLRLISAVPGARWRRHRSELCCLFSQIAAQRGSPLLSHNEVCPPLLKSVERFLFLFFFFFFPQNRSGGVHTQTRCSSDRFTQRRVGGPTPLRPAELGREL